MYLGNVRFIKNKAFLSANINRKGTIGMLGSILSGMICWIWEVRAVKYVAQSNVRRRKIVKTVKNVWDLRKYTFHEFLPWL